jgi:IPT/TIG domain/WD40-like Beta Propeller Repeat
MKKINLVILLLSVPLFSVPSAMASRTELISKSSTGEIGNSDSYNPTVSGTGQFVVFDSYASNLVEDDKNGRRDVFYRNRNTGITKLVSVSSGGIHADGDSSHGVISADGSTVAYMSRASDLVAGDNDGFADIFVFEMGSKNTSRITFFAGEEANGDSDYPAISEDGRYIVYQSSASNLVPDDTNEHTDIFRYDRQTGKTVRASLDFQNKEIMDSSSTSASISATGRYVAFQSTAPFITPCDDNSRSDVFRRDMTAGTITKVSVGTYACEANSSSYHPSLSGDGRYVTFYSSASNLLLWSDQEDTNSHNDVFVHDTLLLETERVSVSSSGTEGDGHSGGYGGSMSSDGRYVAFYSEATNLVDGDGNGTYDIYAHDRNTKKTTRESVGHYWEQANDGAAEHSTISADGRYITFDSTASTLVSGDDNGRRDIFLRDYLWAGPLVTAISPSSGDFHGGTVMIITGQNFQAGTKVKFDNSSALNIVVSGSTKITCITPPHVPQKVTITVTNPDEQSWVYPTNAPGFNGYTYRSMAMPWMFLLL